jgi:hypothetical protein
LFADDERPIEDAKMKWIAGSFGIPVALLGGMAVATFAIAQHVHDPGSHAKPAAAPAASVPSRQVVAFPEEMKEHTLANMRDHLLALSEIQDALARFEFDRAADVAEKRLGMSSLGLHGAHEVAKVMPQGMQDIGTAMHRSASRFALVAQEASVDRKLDRPLAALAQVTQSCVACHAAYQLK